ncbi:MAG: STAS domain-containing protein [Planctomycetota bacterium]
MRADLSLRTIREPDGPLLIHLAGVIDAHTLDTFESTMAEAIEQGAREVVLDCEELRYVNSAGFGELIRYHDQLRENEGRLVLARVPPKVGVILEMLGLKSLIPVATGLDDARTLARQQQSPITTETTRPVPPSTLQVAPPVVNAPAAPQKSVPGNVPGDQTVVCAVCDARLRIAGEGEWACASCGAPFTVTRQGGIAFDWSRAEADGVHLTFDVSPRTLAAFAGLLEGILVERRVSHARMRRFAREAAHVCHLLAENAFDEDSRGPLHVLALAGPQRLHVRVVDRGRSLAERSERIFSTQKRLFLDFRYGSQVEGVNITEFAFAYAGSGVFVA